MRSNKERTTLGGRPPEARENHDRAPQHCPSRPLRAGFQAEAIPAHTREETDARLMQRVQDAGPLPVSGDRSPQLRAAHGGSGRMCGNMAALCPRELPTTSCVELP